MAGITRNELLAMVAAGRTAQPGPVIAAPVVGPAVAAQAAAPPRPRAGTLAWGGSFLTPAEIVARSNARGAPTTLAQFLANHPAAAALLGQRAGASAAPRPSVRQPLHQAIAVGQERRAYSYE